MFNKGVSVPHKDKCYRFVHPWYLSPLVVTFQSCQIHLPAVSRHYKGWHRPYRREGI